jgi:hypothetical protein
MLICNGKKHLKRANFKYNYFLIINRRRTYLVGLRDEIKVFKMTTGLLSDKSTYYHKSLG